MNNRSKSGINSRKLGSFLALLSFTAYMPVSCLPAFADISSTALPDLNKAVNGSVSTDGNRMDVSVNGGMGTVGQFDWNTFNVGKDAQVNWVFNANSQTALNRVLASGGMSYIYGKLTESSGSGCPSCVNTSKVILINPSGILFGNGSSVNLNSFTASTFDIKGAKNLKDLSPDELKAYAGTITSTSGKNGTLFDIAGYNKTVSFVANDNMVDGNGYITSNSAGTRLASIVADGSTIDANKTIAMVGNKIDISNSKLTTTYDSTPNASNATQTRSNIKLVTGDGVNFYYTSAGNVNNSISVSKATKASNQEYGINIADSQLRTGNFVAYNGVEKDNSSVNIDNSLIYTKKLLGTDTGSLTAEQTGTDGNISISSGGKVNITDSDIQTTNEKVDGVMVTTGIGYGNMSISAKNDVTIKNTQLRSADSKVNTDSSNITAGNIKISSSAGNVNLVQDAPTNSTIYNNTGIAAAGDLTISAAGDVNVTDYNKIQAAGHGTANNASSNTARTITVDAANANFAGTLLNAKNLVVNADNNINVNNTKVVADNTKLLGTNTTIDNSLLQYNDLSFYDASSTKTNNVTIKNDSTFNDKDSDGLKITTNGNLTLDNAKLQKQSYSGTTKSNQKSVALESTTGNITIQNDSDVITSGGAFTAKANNGAIAVSNSRVYATNGNNELTAKNNITASNSTIWAKNGNTKLTSSAGKVVATGSSIAAEGGDTTIDQALSMNINTDLKGSTVGATNKLTLNSKGDITGGKLTAGTGYINDYKNLVSLNDAANDTHLIYSGAAVNAGKNISITDLQSAKKVDFTAGNNINLASTVDMNLADVSVNAGNTTNIAAAAKLTTDTLEILGGTKTTLSGDTVKTLGSSAIKTNGNKLAVNANGAVDIGVTGVNNVNNGIEINADVNTSKGSAPLAGKTVKVNAQDGTLAISKIKADTLDLIADNILAAKTTISAATDNINGEDGLAASGTNLDGKGYIEVKTDGGFNLDKSTTYDSTGSVKYNDNYNKVITDTNTTHSDRDVVTSKDNVTYGEKLVGSEINETTNVVKETVVDTKTEQVRNDNVVKDGVEGYEIVTTTTETIDTAYETTKTDTYQGTKTTTTTTTTTTYDDWTKTDTVREDQHVATLNNQQENGFVLVYGKSKTDVTSGTDKKGTTVETSDPVTVNWGDTYTKIDTSYDGRSDENVVVKRTERVTTDKTFCEYEEDITPDLGGDDISSWVKIPRHAEGTSNVAPVQNDLADTTATVVAAAARLQLDDSDDDDSILE